MVMAEDTFRNAVLLLVNGGGVVLLLYIKII